MRSVWVSKRVRSVHLLPNGNAASQRASDMAGVIIGSTDSQSAWSCFGDARLLELFFGLSISLDHILATGGDLEHIFIRSPFRASSLVAFQDGDAFLTYMQVVFTDRAGHTTGPGIVTVQDKCNPTMRSSRRVRMQNKRKAKKREGNEMKQESMMRSKE